MWPVIKVEQAFKLSGPHLLHHMIGAALIASLMLALEGLHVLEWLDAAMLRASGEQSEMAPQRKDPGAAYRPGIVEIDEPSFQQVFKEREPLERSRLEQLLESTANQGAQVIAVDLDLAPALYEEPGHRPLDALLDRLAGAGKQLILTLPEVSTSNANLAWIRARCAAGVHFASPVIHERMGAVTRVELKSPVLSAVTFELAHGMQGQGQNEPMPAALSEQKEGASLADRVCALARRTASEKDLARWAGQPALHGDGDAKDAAEQNAVTAPFHPTALAPQFLNPTRARVKLIDDKAATDAGAAAKKVVFIGASHDVLDQFTTAEGSLPRLHLHAASYTSLGIGTADVNKYAVFVIDIVLGVFLGCLFGGLWTMYGQAELAVDGKMSDDSLDRLHRAGSLAAFYGVRVMMIVVWATPFLIGALAMYLSHGLLEQGWWVNPGPLIAGMFLHAMSLRDEALHPHQEIEGLSVWTQLRRTHPGAVLVQAPLALVFFILAVI